MLLHRTASRAAASGCSHGGAASVMKIALLWEYKAASSVKNHNNYKGIA
jgi:hypothetical protein